MKKTLITTIASLAAILVAGVAISSPAMAVQAGSPKPPDTSAVEEFLEGQGVPEPTIQALAAKLQRGELLDSQRSSQNPVSTTTTGGETKFVYADGSVRVVELTAAPGPQTLGNTISGCTFQGGTGSVSYSNCLVQTTDGITVLQFRSGYSRWSGGASVQNWNSASAATAYGSVTTATFTFTRAQYNGAPATVQAHTHFESWNHLSSEDIYLNLNVTPSAAAVSVY